MLVGVVLTASRGGIMVAAIVTAPWWWRALPQRRRLLWLMVMVGALGFFAHGDEPIASSEPF